ncbi:hypothetical protein ACFQJC_03610 [Haloferax namakaokahaiae]|uniref:Sulfite exporter TauE/SafE family protein n=1 Tax=Haloferax namakaokahaiae TaxID=1748331 RepID=A0ABD5ZBP7_9EURY
MHPPISPSRFDLTLAVMAAFVLGGGTLGVLLSIPLYLGMSSGATGAAAVAVVTTISEL